MAEYDREFIKRMAEMGYEEMMAYLQGLPEREREAMEKAINRAVSQRAVEDHHLWLRGGI